MFLKRQLPVYIMVTVGILTLLGHFIEGGFIETFIKEDSISWFNIIASFSILLGAFNLLNVNSNTLLKFGAVSEEVVKEMSLGILKITKSTVVIAISGIMGPGSDREEVWISIRSKNKERSTHYPLMSGNRDMNREYAAENAIRELYHFIKEI